MLSMSDINAIGNILDKTVGRGGDGSRSITGTMSGDVLTLKFATIVNFASENSLRLQADRMAEESIAVLADRISSLKKFVDLKPSENELLYKLEQWRALDSNMTIGTKYIDESYFGVDTEEDLLKVKKIMEK